MCFLGILLYQQFARKTELLYVENTEQLLNQTAISLEDYLRSMRRISDAMYYSVIKDKDLATEGLDEEMDLLYEANKDNLVSIACYARDGGLVAAAPIANMKAGISVTDQEWFQDAVDQLENFHFSTPHVQNLFDDPSYRYHWVVSLSRTVELTNNGGTMHVPVKDASGKAIAGEYKVALEGEEGATTTLVATNGTLKVTGLDEGNYEFKETKAPTGYSVNSANKAFTITASDNAEVSVDAGQFVNTKLSALPATGGIGTTIFTIVGCGIMIAAAGLFFASRRKENR